MLFLKLSSQLLHLPSASQRENIRESHSQKSGLAAIPAGPALYSLTSRPVRTIRPSPWTSLSLGRLGTSKERKGGRGHPEPAQSKPCCYKDHLCSFSSKVHLDTSSTLPKTDPPSLHTDASSPLLTSQFKPAHKSLTATHPCTNTCLAYPALLLPGLNLLLSEKHHINKKAKAAVTSLLQNKL